MHIILISQIYYYAQSIIINILTQISMENNPHQQPQPHHQIKHPAHPNTNETLNYQPNPSQSNNKKGRLFQKYWYIIEQKLLNSMQVTTQQRQTYKNLLLRSLKDKKIDKALGAIYGAMIADSLGAYCEFQSHLQKKTVDQAMEMNGGGTFGLFPGQFTDDSELASHLLKGLNHLNPKKSLKEQQNKLICQLGLQYIKWIKSRPFDIGTTCRSGINSVNEHIENLKQYIEDQSTEQPPFFQSMFTTIYSRNNEKMSNGSLMRISPFASFFSIIEENPLEHQTFIKSTNNTMSDEIRLTHSNQRLGVAGFFWVNLLTNLICRKGDSAQEFAKILNECIGNEKFKPIKSWIKQASTFKQVAMPASPNMGYAKIAFSYGLKILFYLAQGKQSPDRVDLYQDWIRWIIQRAGDTDTNGAIAGGLIGSVIGFWNLPQKYVTKTLITMLDGRNFQLKGNKVDEQIHFMFENFKSKKGIKRNRCYEPCSVLLSALDMIKNGEDYRKNKCKQN